MKKLASIFFIGLSSTLLTTLLSYSFIKFTISSRLQCCFSSSSQLLFPKVSCFWLAPFYNKNLMIWQLRSL